ncbi:MAG: hypothetical protein AAF289_07930 [Cyanobacteria bacterium P01_A01_bin.135]
MNSTEGNINQPTQPEDVSREQYEAQQKELEKNPNATLNPGDRVDGPQSLDEKAKQVAVDAPDVTGDHVTVPTYFVVEGEDGDKEALHHVKDAEEISDVIRDARTDDDGNRTWR